MIDDNLRKEDLFSFSLRFKKFISTGSCCMIFCFEKALRALLLSSSNKFVDSFASVSSLISTTGSKTTTSSIGCCFRFVSALTVLSNCSTKRRAVSVDVICWACAVFG
uniref:Uncharacterized protein n=1 Tax=Romanomermis culicivorax TaxID=13658 RepID=A0A915KX57_ROMCU